jgi:hypothetical protein
MPEMGVKSGVRVALTSAAVKGKPLAPAVDGMHLRSVLKMLTLYINPVRACGPGQWLKANQHADNHG